VIDKPEPSDETRWSFMSNHCLVLLCIARNPEMRLRDVADHVGITERAVQRIVADLEVDGYLTRARTGRRNTYEVHLDLPLRHPNLNRRSVRTMLAPFLGSDAQPESVRSYRDADDGGSRPVRR
jgi:hypothetical protein